MTLLKAPPTGGRTVKSATETSKLCRHIPTLTLMHSLLTGTRNIKLDVLALGILL